MTNNHSTVSKRGVLLVSILALSAGELMAQGTSPGCKPSTCCKPRSPDPLREDSA